MIEHTLHSAIRSAQRGLTDEEIEYVYQFASRYHHCGALVYYLRWDDLPLEDQRSAFATQLVGTALVVALDGQTLLTTWRNRRRGMKIIRRFARRSHRDKNRQIEGYGEEASQ